MTNRPDENGNIINPDEEPEIIPPPDSGGRYQVERIHQPQPRSQNGGDSGFDWMKAILASIGVSVITAGVLIFGGILVPSGEYTKYQNDVLELLNSYDTVIQRIEADLDQALADIPNTITSKVDDGINNIKTQINDLKTQVQTAVNDANSASNGYDNLNSSFNNIQSKITSLENSVSSLNSQMSTVITQSDLDDISQTLDTIKAQIGVLETELDKITSGSGGDGGSTTTGELTVDIKQQTNYLTIVGNESIGIMRITIENTTDKDMEDIILGIGFQLPYSVSVDSLMITGGLQGWIPASPFDILYQRTAGWGYTLQANSKITFDITAKFSDGGTDIGQQYYAVELFLESWDYK